MAPTVDSLRHYYWFWVGQQVSSAGSAVVSFVLIWWITITTGSAWYLALSSALSFGMMIISQLLAGYVADFLNRKYVITLVDGLQAVATMVLVLLFYLDLQSIQLVLLILAIRGLFDGFHRPATGAIIPTMVPPEKLQRVNSLSSMSRSLINLGSAPLAAMLLVLFRDSIWLILLLDTLTFCIALLPLLTITIPAVQPNTSAGLLSKLTEGYHFLRSSTGLMPLLLIFASFNFFITPVSVLTPLVLLSPRGFASSESVFALTLMSSSIGTLLMSSLLTKINIPVVETKGIMLGFSITLIGLFCMSWSIMTHQLFLFIVGNILIGVSLPVVNIFSAIVWQTRVPQELQGRVISVRMMVVMWALPVFTLIVGAIAETISLGFLFLAAGLLFSISILIIWFFTDFQKLIQPPIQEKSIQTVSVAVS